MEILDDQELIALQGELGKLVDDWKMEFETRDKGKPDYAPQQKLEKFLQEKWNTSKYDLDLVIAKKAWDDLDNMRPIDLISDENRRMSENGLQIITLDALHEIREPGNRQDGEEFLIIPSNSPLFRIVNRDKDITPLNLYPDEIEGFRLVRKKQEDQQHFKPRVKHGLEYRVGDVQDFGYQIDTLPGLAKAWQEADRLGEELIVRLTDGRVCIVGRGTMGPLEPTVPIFWDDENDKPRSGKMGAWDFFRLEPVVYNPLKNKVD